MISPAKFCQSLSELALSKGFTVDTLAQVSDLPILTFQKLGNSDSKRPFHLYLSSGVHGDEPAGPLTLERLLKNDLLPTDIDITILPFINPTGFESQTRENANGHDLNRDFRYPKNPETKAVKTFLDAHPPFDLSISLHEDWESTGFYMYSLSPDADPSIASEILDAASKEGPLDLASMIDESPATQGLIDRPANFDIDGRDDWPEAFLLYSSSRHAHYTFESPSAASIEQRIAQQTAAILRAIELHRI